MRALLLGLTLLVPGLAAGSDLPKGYEGARWGMTPAQLKKAVPGLKQAKEKSEVLTFEKLGSMEGLLTLTRYAFLDGHLEAVRVVFEVGRSDATNQVVNFDVIEGVLTSKYGPGDGLKRQWKSPADEGGEEASAVEAGRLTLEHVWSGPESQLTHRLARGGDSFTHFLDVASPRFTAWRLKSGLQQPADAARAGGAR